MMDIFRARNSSETSNESEEFSIITSDIDYMIYDECKQSNLKIIFMNKSDLRKFRTNKSYEK